MQRKENKNQLGKHNWYMHSAYIRETAGSSPPPSTIVGQNSTRNQRDRYDT